MFADRAAQKLSEVFDTLNGDVRDVTIRGTGLGGTARIRGNGADRAPTQVAEASVIFALQPAEVTQRQRLRIQLVTAGGDASKELVLYISDVSITTDVLPPATGGQAYGPVELVAAGTAVPRKWTQQGLPDLLTLSGTPGCSPERRRRMPLG